MPAVSCPEGQLLALLCRQRPVVGHRATKQSVRQKHGVSRPHLAEAASLRRAGDSQALPGYVSLYLQVTDPKASRWDCFASYRLAVVHQADEAKSIARDSWHRFSSRVARPTAVARPASSSHGWADFGPVATIADARQARALPAPGGRAACAICGLIKPRPQGGELNKRLTMYAYGSLALKAPQCVVQGRATLCFWPLCCGSESKGISRSAGGFGGQLLVVAADILVPDEVVSAFLKPITRSAGLPD